MTDAPSTARLDRLVHHQANAARRSNGVAPLGWSAGLAAVAEAHSRDMARGGYFDHTNRRGDGAVERLGRAGIRCQTTAENLYVTTRYRSATTRRGPTVYDWFTPREIAQRTIDGWLDSPGHRRNLLDSGLQAHGIGIALGSGRKVYITQVLCR